MENQRHILFIALIAISAVLYMKWAEFAADPTNATQVQTAPNVVGSDLPELPVEANSNTSTQVNNGGVPSIEATSNESLPAIPELKVVNDLSTVITVETDMVVAHINTIGGVIERLELKEEPIALDKPDQGFPLLHKTSDDVYIAQDGILSARGAPSHQTPYQSSKNNYVLGSANQVKVPLTYVSETGVVFTKTLTFTSNSYVVDIEYSVLNATDTVWSGYQYAQFSRSIPETSGGGFGQLPSYTGAAIYTEEEKYQKVDFDDLDDLQKKPVNGKLGLQVETDNGWVAMLQHYFVGAWIPNDGVKKFYSSVATTGMTQYRVGFKDTAATVVQPGGTGVFSVRAYLGSKQQSRLRQLEEDGVDGLALTVDYGMLTFIADPLFTALSWFHSLVGNWGWAIILLTIAIKALFYPLSAASYRSMGKMRKLQPRLQTLKERYKDDRQKFQMEMMGLYKKEKVNPAGGCLPMLIQIPVFIALYWVLLESVEMRQAPFALWWQDLSAKDPYFVLPVLMGVSMFFMQKLNPAPMDDIQKKVFMIMPFALTFLFMTFPQGLVLYWVVNNLLTMAQQWFNYKQQENN